MEFTKEIKQNWLKALKSGKYKQLCSGQYVDSNKHCCLAVYGEINKIRFEDTVNYFYKFLGVEKYNNLISTNDKDYNSKSYKFDYSNVIPLIEALPTVD